MQSVGAFWVDLVMRRIAAETALVLCTLGPKIGGYELDESDCKRFGELRATGRRAE